MVDLTYQMALNTLQTTGLLLGILYYVMDLRNQREDQRLALWNQEQTLKTRKITLYQQTIGSLTMSPMGIKNITILNKNQPSSYEEHIELSNNNLEYYAAWIWMINTFETLGIYLKEGVLDIGMLAKFNPWWFIRFWNQYKPIVIAQRKGIGPNYMVYMEYLIESLQKYIEEHPELITP